MSLFGLIFITFWIIFRLIYSPSFASLSGYLTVQHLRHYYLLISALIFRTCRAPFVTFWLLIFLLIFPPSLAGLNGRLVYNIYAIKKCFNSSINIYYMSSNIVIFVTLLIFHLIFVSFWIIFRLIVSPSLAGLNEHLITTRHRLILISACRVIFITFLLTFRLIFSSLFFGRPERTSCVQHLWRGREEPVQHQRQRDHLHQGAFGSWGPELLQPGHTRLWHVQEPQGQAYLHCTGQFEVTEVS